MPTTTARGAMPAPTLAEAADGPAGIGALATQIAGQVLLGSSGLLSARPTPVAADVDRYYFATDNGLYYRWSGTTWVTVNPIDAAAGTGSMRTLGTGAAQAAPGNDARILGATQITAGTLAGRPAAGTANRLYRTTDTKQLFLDTGTEWLTIGGSSTFSTPLAFNAAFPASPVEGQEVYRWSDASNTGLWKFRFHAANPVGYQWQFVGGSDYFVDLGGVGTNSTAGTWSNISGGPIWTPGIGGEFIFTYGVNSAHMSSSSDLRDVLSLGIKNVTAPTTTGVSTDGNWHALGSASTGNPGQTTGEISLLKDFTLSIGQDFCVYATTFLGNTISTLDIYVKIRPHQNG